MDFLMRLSLWSMNTLKKIITYTLEHEMGTTLKAAGWVVEHRTKGRSWSTACRLRDDKTPTVDKLRWTPSAMAHISVSKPPYRSNASLLRSFDVPASSRITEIQSCCRG